MLCRWHQSLTIKWQSVHEMCQDVSVGTAFWCCLACSAQGWCHASLGKLPCLRWSPMKGSTRNKQAMTPTSIYGDLQLDNKLCCVCVQFTQHARWRSKEFQMLVDWFTCRAWPELHEICGICWYHHHLKSAIIMVLNMHKISQMTKRCRHYILMLRFSSHCKLWFGSEVVQY